MKIEDFLAHHGIEGNPFSEEDAQTDLIFKRHCIESTFHPAWDKVYGDPSEPAASIVFGEKGAGKTALRMQIARHLEQYNRANPDEKVFVIEYDDFNPFLDRFRDHLHGRRRRIDKALKQWKLWDHIDGILTLGTTGLVDGVLETRRPTGWDGCRVTSEEAQRLDRHQSRDLLLLAACYDHSTAETFLGRWARLKRVLRFGTLKAQWDFALGIGISVLMVALVLTLMLNGQWDWVSPFWLYLLVTGAGWFPWTRRCLKNFFTAWKVTHRQKVGNHERKEIRKALMSFTSSEISGQPLPTRDRTDDRYEMLYKFLGIIRTFGYSGLIILVDRVDEPHLINGSPELMKDFVWPMLDNKFLKQSDVGVKLLLPAELNDFIQRENREFYERARLDKQNMIPSLQWTSEALYDLADSRIRACAVEGQSPQLKALFGDAIDQQRLLSSFQLLRVPRHLFKFIYRLLVAHCGAHTDADPVWQISSDTYESVLSAYRRDQDAFDRGLGAG